MSYEILRTDTADALIRNLILRIAEAFGTDTAQTCLDELEYSIMLLADTPWIGSEPRYPVLRRMGYRVLILDRNLVFYKVHEERRQVVIHAVVDQRQDYINILRGL